MSAYISQALPLLYLYTKKQLKVEGVEGLRMRLRDVEKELNVCLTVCVKVAGYRLRVHTYRIIIQNLGTHITIFI